MRRRRPTGDLGQILPLVLVMVALGAAMALLVAELGVVAVDRARARSAADAAALAAVTERGRRTHRGQGVRLGKRSPTRVL